MKKTKLLIVIALAVLATLAMSACGLIVNSVSDIEFVKMPKTYYSTTDIETNGITIELNVTSSSTLIPEEIEWTIKADNATTTVDGLTLTATGYKTTMGEWELVVKDANGTVEISAYYRVCEVIDGTNYDSAEAELKAVLGDTTATDTGFYMLESDLSYTESLVAKRSFVLYGEGNEIESTANEVLTIGCTSTEWTEKGLYIDGGLYELNNVSLISTHVTNYCKALCVRGIKNATINMNACYFEVITYYAINFTASTENLTVNISNGTASAGWAAINIWSDNSVFNIDSAELIGASVHTGDSNNFGTFVLNNSKNCVVNMTNAKLIAVNNELDSKPADNKGWMDHIIIQDCDNNGNKVLDDDEHALNNVVNIVNCMYSIDGTTFKAVVDTDNRENGGFRYITDNNTNIITIK